MINKDVFQNTEHLLKLEVCQNLMENSVIFVNLRLKMLPTSILV